MRKIYHVSALIILFFSVAFNTSGFAQNAASAEQEAKVQSILKNLSRFVTGKAADFSYDNLEFDEKENKYTVINLRPGREKAGSVKNKLQIQNYKEDDDKFSIGWLSIRAKDLKPPHHSKQTPPEFAIILSDIEGSFKDSELDVDKAEFVIIEGEDKKQQDLSGVTVIVDDLKVEDLRQLRSFFELAEIVKGDPSGKERLKDFFERNLITVLGYVSFDQLVMKGFPKQLDPEGKIVKVKNLKIDKLEDGIIDNVEINGIEVDDPNNPKFQKGIIGKVSVQEIDLNRIIKIGQKNKFKAQRIPPTPEDIEDILQFAKGFSIKNTEMAGPAGFFAIKHFDINWNNFVGPFPTKINLSGDISVRPDEIDEKNARFLDMLEVMGIDIMNMKFDIRIAWDEGSNALIIKPFMYDVDKLVEVNFSAKMTNISKQLLLEKDPQKMLIMAMGANIGDITLKFSDKGILRLLDENAKMRWDLMKEQFALDPNLAPIIEDLNRFLEKPNGTFEATMKPKGPVNFAQLAAMSQMGPNMLFSLFDIRTEYVGKSNL